MMLWGNGMDRVILLPRCWGIWRESDIARIHRSELPPVFNLIVSPELYVRQGLESQIMWSEFQKNELDFIANSSHGIVRCSLLAQFTPGAWCASILDYKIWGYQDEKFLFQGSTEQDPKKIGQYLKRFGVTYQPESIDLKKPSLWMLFRQPNFVDVDLAKSYRRAYWRQGIIAGLVGINLVLAGGMINAAQSAWTHWSEIKTYTTSTLTDSQKDQARLYRAYQGLIQASDLSHAIYDRFVQEWRGRLVVTTLSLDSSDCKWQFVLHPDFKDQVHPISDWLDIHAPGSNFKEPEGDGDYQVSIPLTEGGA
jgi:hypothetical protein